MRKQSLRPAFLADLFGKHQGFLFTVDNQDPAVCVAVHFDDLVTGLEPNGGSLRIRFDLINNGSQIFGGRASRRKTSRCLVAKLVDDIIPSRRA